MSDSTNPFAVEPAADDPFAVLARRRAELGMKFADVAQQLKFTPRQIEALEAADFEHLPTGTFARGMLRSYARLLKLDPAPMLTALSQRVGDATPIPEHSVALRASVPFSDGGRRVNLAYVALSVGFLVAAGALLFEWTQERGGAAPLAFVPAAQTSPAPVASAPPTMVSSAAPLPVIVNAETATQREPAMEPASADGTKRIHLRFERQAWVQITDRAGRTLMSQLNPAGSEQSVEGRPPFALVIGNASYVRMTYDRKPVDLSPHVKVEVARLTLD